ncbi:hypothetical protein MIR68_004955 [Amoeboaphelidium protococcarum]|nr:hypothetical protein MIR68_004955 [Amoeboaphelidium protococcarum]
MSDENDNSLIQQYNSGDHQWNSHLSSAAAATDDAVSVTKHPSNDAESVKVSQFASILDTNNNKQLQQLLPGARSQQRSLKSQEQSQQQDQLLFLSSSSLLSSQQQQEVQSQYQQQPHYHPPLELHSGSKLYSQDNIGLQSALNSSDTLEQQQQQSNSIANINQLHHNQNMLISSALLPNTPPFTPKRSGSPGCMVSQQVRPQSVLVNSYDDQKGAQVEFENHQGKYNGGQLSKLEGGGKETNHLEVAHHGKQQLDLTPDASSAASSTVNVFDDHHQYGSFDQLEQLLTGSGNLLNDIEVSGGGASCGDHSYLLDFHYGGGNHHGQMQQQQSFNVCGQQNNLTESKNTQKEDENDGVFISQQAQQQQQQDFYTLGLSPLFKNAAASFGMALNLQEVPLYNQHHQLHHQQQQQQHHSHNNGMGSDGQYGSSLLLGSGNQSAKPSMDKKPSAMRRRAFSMLSNNNSQSPIMHGASIPQVQYQHQVQNRRASINEGAYTSLFDESYWPLETQPTNGQPLLDAMSFLVDSHPGGDCAGAGCHHQHHANHFSGHSVDSLQHFDNAATGKAKKSRKRKKIDDAPVEDGIEGQQLYACDFPGCNKQFDKYHNLKSHVKSHSVERPYACETCGLRFSRNHDLKRHERIHAGVRPYVCEYCQKSFLRLDALNRHLKVNNGRGCRTRVKKDELVQLAVAGMEQLHQDGFSSFHDQALNQQHYA